MKPIWNTAIFCSVTAAAFVVFTPSISLASSCDKQQALDGDATCQHMSEEDATNGNGENNCDQTVKLIEPCVAAATTPTEKGRWYFLLGETYRAASHAALLERFTDQDAKLGIAAYRKALSYPLPQHKIDDSHAALQVLTAQLQRDLNASDR